MTNTAIQHDFKTGRISGAGFAESIGIELMRSAVYLLAPSQFKGFYWAARLVTSVFRSDRQISEVC